jgi:hypothetical protein
MPVQILIDDDSFELLAEGQALGPRRRLDAEALALLDDLPGATGCCWVSALPMPVS